MAGAGLAISLAVAAFLAPLASAHADSLEFVGDRLGFLPEAAPAVVEGPIAGYEMPGLPDVGLATAAAGLVGTLVFFVAGLGLARAFAGRAPGPAPASPRARLPRMTPLAPCGSVSA